VTIHTECAKASYTRGGNWNVTANMVDHPVPTYLSLQLSKSWVVFTLVTRIPNGLPCPIITSYLLHNYLSTLPDLLSRCTNLRAKEEPSPRRFADFCAPLCMITILSTCCSVRPACQVDSHTANCAGPWGLKTLAAIRVCQASTSWRRPWG